MYNITQTQCIPTTIKKRKAKLQLPNPANHASGGSGVCTGPFLQLLYSNCHTPTSMSWAECLFKLRTELQLNGYENIPRLTSSRWIDVWNQPMQVCPPESGGRKRAILIGIHYTGQEGELVRLLFFVRVELY